MLALSREAASAFVEDMVEIRRVLANEGASVAEVRRLSAILRRLLVERDLATITSPRIGRVEILAPDTRPIYKHEKTTPLVFCIIGGSKIFGWSGTIRVMSFQGASHPNQVPDDKLHPKDFDPKARVALRVDNFLAQRVICFQVNELVAGRSSNTSPMLHRAFIPQRLNRERIRSLLIFAHQAISNATPQRAAAFIFKFPIHK